MSCTNCYDLCVKFPARTPGELRKAVSIVGANIADGVIGQVEPDAGSGYSTGPFSPVLAGVEWPDTFNYWFKCMHCGERFSLQADTYHAAAGTWQPARAEAIREEL